MANATWTVTGQQDDQLQVTSSGQPVTGVIISFATGEGNQGTVFVPDQHYNKSTVRKMIQARADLMDEIGLLAQGM